MNDAQLRAIRHELRTPVNHIVGYTELLLEEAQQTEQEGLAADLEKIRDAGEQLHGLIGEMFDPARTTGGLSAEAVQHELRTPLNQVIGYSELLMEEAPDRGLDSYVADLQRINTAARHLGELILRHVEAPHIGSSEEEPAVSAVAGHSVRRRQERGSILLVDDNELNRDMLSRRLAGEGHHVTVAENGRRALELLHSDLFDLVLLDVMMPEMDGFQVLERLKQEARWRHIPVIMLALDDMESVVRCIETGAEDFLHKPFDPVLLRARIGASLEKKRLRDQEQAYLAAIKREQGRAQHLLLNVLPAPVAERLKREEGIIADAYAEVSILFADLVDFSEWAAEVAPATLVTALNELFSSFDRLAERHGLEKIKTIGDAYMAVAGLPVTRPDHAVAAGEMELDMQRARDLCGGRKPSVRDASRDCLWTGGSGSHRYPKIRL